MPRPAIRIEELGKASPVASTGERRSGFDLQDALLINGVLCGEIAAAIIWWPAAFILASLFSLGFAYLIEKSRMKDKQVGDH